MNTDQLEGKMKFLHHSCLSDITHLEFSKSRGSLNVG